MDAQVKKIWTDLKAGKYAPVYFLQGEETFYIDMISDYIEKNALSDAEKGFNQVVLYGKDVTMAAILTNARRYPMMAERQVVIVKEAQDIQDLNKEIGGKLLLDYLTKQVPSTVLVFCHKHKSLDKRRDLGKKVDQYAVMLNSKKLYDNQLPEFVYEYLKEKKVQVDDRAVQVLCEYVGNDLHRLANEIDKLTISLAAGESITVDQVMNQVGVSKEYNIFELQKAILQRDTVLANKIVNYFAGNTRKNPIIPVVAFLYSFFSKLLMATQVADKSEKGIASELKVSPYAVRDYTLALRQYPPMKIIDNIAALKEADLKLKGVNTGSADDAQIFKELIWRLMNERAA
ncbi:DNA polymerase III subunit delta [Chryseolinea sp. H1M3-3]|uniref:DNA polymerase III subunit delta n=1 Tax=Chryseolinea sp. H1M3-3 TaxID=3034144 RepID=UPI0023ECF181|nr:DNA polymerase III subunit delta [Chryseolinea sp. H1M3-3]